MGQPKLSGSQQAQLAFLITLPPRFERIQRQIEEIATLRADDMIQRNLARSLDQLRNECAGLTLNSLADVFGMMGSVARRSGGVQMKVRGLREGLVSLRINYDGALKAATTAGSAPQDDDQGSD